MNETDPLKRLYRRLRANVTQGVAGDVMLMPPSWGELLTAVHEAAFPDGDDDTTSVTSGIEAVKRIAYGEGWDDGYKEGHAAGYRKAVLRFGRGEA